MTLQTIFRRKIEQLFKEMGPRGWWPRLIISKLKIKNAKFRKVDLTIKHHPGSKSRWILRGKALEVWEVGIGAILTQNTNWFNVEKALLSLAQAGVLTPQQVAKCPLRKLESLIKSAGYYKQKAKKLKILARFFIERPSDIPSTTLRAGLNGVGRSEGSPPSQQVGILRKTQNDRLNKLRSELLSLWGVGPETADTILLYGFGLPVFVVDAYTRRLLTQLSGDGSWLTKPYDEVREFCEDASDRFPLDPPLLKGEASTYSRGGGINQRVQVFQEAHALIVNSKPDKPKLDTLIVPGGQVNGALR